MLCREKPSNGTKEDQTTKYSVFLYDIITKIQVIFSRKEEHICLFRIKKGAKVKLRWKRKAVLIAEHYSMDDQINKRDMVVKVGLHRGVYSNLPFIFCYIISNINKL